MSKMTPERRRFLLDNFDLLAWQERWEILTQLHEERGYICEECGEKMLRGAAERGVLLCNPPQIEFACPNKHIKRVALF